MASEMGVIEQLKAVNTQLEQTLVDQEKLRRTLRDEVLKLAWKIGVPQDDKPVLEAADLTLEHLVQTVGRWVDGAIERTAKKREQALWMEAVVPQLMAELECMLRNDGQGERYDEREWRLARGEVQRLVQQLRDAGVEAMTMRDDQEVARGEVRPLVQRITYTAESLAGGGKSGGAA